MGNKIAIPSKNPILVTYWNKNKRDSNYWKNNVAQVLVWLFIGEFMSYPEKGIQNSKRGRNFSCDAEKRTKTKILCELQRSERNQSEKQTSGSAWLVASPLLWNGPRVRSDQLAEQVRWSNIDGRELISLGWFWTVRVLHIHLVEILRLCGDLLVWWIDSFVDEVWLWVLIEDSRRKDTSHGQRPKTFTLVDMCFLRGDQNDYLHSHGPSKLKQCNIQILHTLQI